MSSFRERLARRALLAGSLAMGLTLGSGVAYAYWTMSAIDTQNSPLISGTFDLTVNGQLANQQGGTVAWNNAFSGAQNLYPLESWAEQVPLTIGNASTGDHAYLVATITAQATNIVGYQNNSSEAPGAHLTVTTYLNSSGATNTPSSSIPHRSGTCTGGTQISSVPLSNFANPVTLVTTAKLNPGDTSIDNLCFLVTVDSAYQNPASTGMSGGSANFSLSISAQQVQP